MATSSMVGINGKPKIQLTSKTRRGHGKGKCRSRNLSILGNNVNGILGKLDSLNCAINVFDHPSIITLQECKTRNREVKINGYQIFPKNGKNEGLITAIDDRIEAIQVSDTEENILVVEININGSKIRVFNVYGPQEPQNSSEREKSFNFWLEVERQIKDAQKNMCKIILQCDANAKLGKAFFSKDPHVQSENGLILQELVLRSGLFIVNMDDKCSGSITRHRQTIHGNEKSIIDFLIICENMKTTFEQMKIDEERTHVLTKYCTTKGFQSKTESDHNLIFAKFNIKFSKPPYKVKREIFNFKNPECQKKFKEVTDRTVKLSSCFENDTLSFENQTKEFLKNLDGIFHQCFTKIRITNKSKNTKQGDEVQLFIEHRQKIASFLKDARSELMKKWCAEKIVQFDALISDQISSRNANTIKTQISNMSSADGKLSRSGFWKLKTSIFPQITEPPIAKRDAYGNIVTAVQSLKNLYLRTYEHRLRPRPMEEQMSELKILKSNLWEGRFQSLRNRKSEPWTMCDLEKVLKCLKKNQTRDAHEMINEIFKPPVIGDDLKTALLYLMNNIKSNMKIPTFMQVTNITTLSKKKSSKLDVEGERGIFILPVLRKILDKLIFNDIYKAIDQSMSDSNIGARKGRHSKNHLFLLYGIVNHVLHESKSNIDICIYDIEKCFDALWLEDCANDLFDSLPSKLRNDKLALVYETNRNNFVAVKTAVGLTERVNVENIVTQGGVFGPIECSNSIDQIGKKSSEEDPKNIFKYKKLVSIPPLGYIDDILSVAHCGQASLSQNTSINSQIETKKLKFHTPDAKGNSKCHFIHVGKSNMPCPELQVHGTKVSRVEDETYLGDIISSDGKNLKNIKSRVAKGLGIISQIMTMLETITVGNHYFETAVLLRESLFLNSILTNAEVWYGVTSSDLKYLADLDKSLLRKIFNAPFSTPIESL